MGTIRKYSTYEQHQMCHCLIVVCCCWKVILEHSINTLRYKLKDFIWISQDCGASYQLYVTICYAVLFLQNLLQQADLKINKKINTTASNMFKACINMMILCYKIVSNYWWRIMSTGHVMRIATPYCIIWRVAISTQTMLYY